MLRYNTIFDNKPTANRQMEFCSEQLNEAIQRCDDNAAKCKGNILQRLKNAAHTYTEQSMFIVVEGVLMNGYEQAAIRLRQLRDEWSEMDDDPLQEEALKRANREEQCERGVYNPVNRWNLSELD